MNKDLTLKHLNYKNPTINGWIFLLYQNSKIGQIKYYYMYLTKCFNLMEFEIKTQYRNQGFGKYLLQNAIKILVENYNSNKILLHVKTNNVKALTIYKNAGFKIIKSSNTTYTKYYIMQHGL